MKNLITNYGKGLAATAFKNSITKFVLIGASTNNDTSLSSLLDKDTSVVKDFNIFDNTSPLFSYIITELSPISTSMVDNDRRMIFKIELRPNFIPEREFVYAIALTDDQGNVCSISSFKTPFNRVNDAGEIITIKHILASDEISGNDFNILSDGDAYLTREEFVSWISNHNHDDRSVSKRELSDAITIIDDKKADNTLIGNLNSVNTADKSSIEKILNEIIDHIGDMSKLDSILRNNIVDSLIKLREELGDHTDLNIVSSNFVDALNKLKEEIDTAPEPNFKDNVSVGDVYWSDKADISYIGDINDYHGSAKNTIISALNEIYDQMLPNSNSVHIIDRININVNYKLFDVSQNYNGTVKVKFIRKDILVTSFKVDVNTLPNSIKIYDVFIDDSIKTLNIISENNNLENYILGFAIVFKDGNLYLSVKTDKDDNGDKLFDTIEINYADTNTISVLTEEPFSSEGSIAIREGSGNYIDDAYKHVSIDILDTDKKYTILNATKKFDARVYLTKDDIVVSAFDISSDGYGDFSTSNHRYRDIDNTINSTLIKDKTYGFPLFASDGLFVLSDSNVYITSYERSLDISIINRDGYLDSIDVTNDYNTNIDVVKKTSNGSEIVYTLSPIQKRDTIEKIVFSKRWLKREVDIKFFKYKPTTKSELQQLLNDKRIPLDFIDTSLITDMSGLFENSDRTNEEFFGLNTWDVSNVTDASSMFKGCSNLNQPLDNWDTSSMITIDNMFENCLAFDQDINNWDVSNIRSMNNAFNNCYRIPYWYVSEGVMFRVKIPIDSLPIGAIKGSKLIELGSIEGVNTNIYLNTNNLIEKEALINNQDSIQYVKVYN